MKQLSVLLVTILLVSVLVQAVDNQTNSSSNFSSNSASASGSNASVNISKKEPVSQNESALNASCGRQYECRLADAKLRQFWFGCYYESGICRCFKGDLTSCNPTKSSFSSDDFCAYQFECVKRPDGNYQFNCFFEKNRSVCKCFSGDLDQCRGEKSLLNKTYLLSLQAKERPLNVSAPVSNVSQEPVADQPSNMNNAYLIGTIVLVFLIIAAVLVLFFRETPEGDLNKARHYHKMAEDLHDKGKDEEAKKYYSLAEKYREKSRKVEE